MVFWCSVQIVILNPNWPQNGWDIAKKSYAQCPYTYIDTYALLGSYLCQMTIFFNKTKSVWLLPLICTLPNLHIKPSLIVHNIMNPKKPLKCTNYAMCQFAFSDKSLIFLKASWGFAAFTGKNMKYRRGGQP